MTSERANALSRRHGRLRPAPGCSSHIFAGTLIHGSKALIIGANGQMRGMADESPARSSPERSNVTRAATIVMSDPTMKLRFIENRPRRTPNASNQSRTQITTKSRVKKATRVIQRPQVIHGHQNTVTGLGTANSFARLPNGHGPVSADGNRTNFPLAPNPCPG